MSVVDSLRYHWYVDVLGKSALRWRRLQAERRGRARWRSEVLAPPLKISAWTKELVGRHYLKGNFANGHHKVAWVTSGAPVEFLKALDFYILYPENHGAVCGTIRGKRHCPGAERPGSGRHCFLNYASVVSRPASCGRRRRLRSSRCPAGTWWPAPEPAKGKDRR